MRLRPLPLLLALPSALAWSCSEVGTDKGVLDLSPLAGAKVATTEMETPPTKNIARVRLDLCGTLQKEDGVKDEDQCKDDTRACLTITNHKEGASDPDRVTTVVPLWRADTPESDISVRGKEGDWNLEVKGPEYAGTPHSLSINLICADADAEPQLESYTAGALKLRWETTAVCANADTGGSSGGGGGFWGFVKWCFWMTFFVGIAYFVLGALYNHQTYNARGWDLVPHRDFWRELPALAGDFGGHVVGNVRSSTGRGGYSSLG